MKEEAIAWALFDEFEQELEQVQSDEAVSQKLELFVNSKLAICISGIGYLFTEPGNIEKLNVICKYMIKKNKKLKKAITNDTTDDSYYASREYADDNPTLVKLSKILFEPGTYYAMLDKKSNYAVLQIIPDKKYRYKFEYRFYLIGKKREKYKDEFYKIYDEYKKISKDTIKEQQLWTAKSGYKDVKFKPFDKCVIRNKAEILAYIDAWVDNIPTYHAYGMIPKLSILLYGQPGTGKSTFYQALADHLGIERVNCLPPEYFASDLNYGDDDEDGHMMRHYGGGSRRGKPENSIWAIDDIDCFGESREDNKSRSNTSTIANLLSFLDNPDSFYFKAKDGKYYLVSIVVATTNYYDKLDPAVKRSGRFDKTIEMLNFNEAEAREMCKIYNLELETIYPDQKFGKDWTVLPADLQAECLAKIDNTLKKKE